MIALVTLWPLKYLEAIVVAGRRGTVSVRLSRPNADEPVLLTLLAGRGFPIRSRTIEYRDVTLFVTCSGRYRVPYPAWSADLMRDLAACQDPSRVEWQDTD